MESPDQPSLFEISPNLRTCPVCKEKFCPRKKDHVHCSAKCYDATYVKRIEESAEHNRSGTIRPLNRLSERQSQMLSEYRRGVGIVSLSRIFKITKRAVIKNLIRTGEYAPNQKHNGKRKKGTGPHSRIRAKERSHFRKSWELESRHKVAVCLNNFRHGIAIETTCHINEWGTSAIWGLIAKTKTWRRRLLRRKIKPIRSYERRYISRAYRTEGVFSDVLAALLQSANVRFDLEFKCEGSSSRTDIKIGNIFVEAKVQTKPNHFDRALGQAIRYRVIDRAEPIICHPDDCIVRQDQRRAAECLGVKVQSATEFLRYLCTLPSLPLIV